MEIETGIEIGIEKHHRGPVRAARAAHERWQVKSQMKRTSERPSRTRLTGSGNPMCLCMSRVVARVVELWRRGHSNFDKCSLFLLRVALSSSSSCGSLLACEFTYCLSRALTLGCKSKVLGGPLLSSHSRPSFSKENKEGPLTEGNPYFHFPIEWLRINSGHVSVHQQPNKHQSQLVAACCRWSSLRHL